MILFFLTIILLSAYALLFAYYTRCWIDVDEFQTPLETDHFPFISVVIAARNEEKNIVNLMSALSRQSYGEQYFEIIVADDHSTDKTVSVINCNPSVLVIKLEPNENGKKAAITKAIENAKGELIVATDADCIPGKDWLKTIAGFYNEKHPVFIAAPVQYIENRSMLSAFQTIDFITLQGITAAAVDSGFHNMCNGANLAYKKDVFTEVNGFSGIDKISSGDDMLLMHKISTRYPGRVHYLKSHDAIVRTIPPLTWGDFFSQRIRWAGKTIHYKDYRIFFALLLVLLINLLFPVLLAAGYYKTVILYLIFKTVIELGFIYPVAKFYNQQRLLKWFLFLQPFHILYTITVGIVSQFTSYRWKGRKTK
jgi:poly-beta-1,6-N-acetyl-D-glucosamine synthase